MPRWLRNTICAIVLLVVCWVVVHPDLDLQPITFRFAVFAAIVMLVLRAAFKFAAAVGIDFQRILVRRAGPDDLPFSSVFAAPIVLRC